MSVSTRTATCQFCGESRPDHYVTCGRVECGGKAYREGLKDAQPTRTPTWEEARALDVEAAVAALSRLANGGGNAAQQLVVERLSREHRTLQQGITGLMLAWMEHLAALPSSRYDLRNEASVKAAKKVMAALNGYVGLPTI